MKLLLQKKVDVLSKQGMKSVKLAAVCVAIHDQRVSVILKVALSVYGECFFLLRFCSFRTWCWLFPLPHANADLVIGEVIDLLESYFVVVRSIPGQALIWNSETCKLLRLIIP